MADDSLSSDRNIFTATHSVFLHQIDRGALPSTRRDFSRHIGWELRKIPTWWEKFRHGGKNSSLEMGHGRTRNKRQGGVHEGIVNQVILFKFPYMGTYPNSFLNFMYPFVLLLLHLCTYYLVNAAMV
jgi:hypothetical protein